MTQVIGASDKGIAMPGLRVAVSRTDLRKPPAPGGSLAWASFMGRFCLCLLALLLVGGGPARAEVVKMTLDELIQRAAPIVEGEFIGVFFDEKIKWIDGDHFRHHVYFDGESPGLFVKHVTGDEIAERILLPVDEMIGRSHVQRVVVHRCAGMGRRTQSNLVRRQRYQSIEQVVGFVMDGDAYGHGFDRLNCNS